MIDGFEYYPIYREVMGSTPGGLVLCRLVAGFIMNEYTIVSDEKLQRMAGVSDAEFRAAKKRLLKVPYIQTETSGKQTRYSFNAAAYVKFYSKKVK